MQCWQLLHLDAAVKLKVIDPLITACAFWKLANCGWVFELSLTEQTKWKYPNVMHLEYCSVNHLQQTVFLFFPPTAKTNIYILNLPQELSETFFPCNLQIQRGIFMHSYLHHGIIKNCLPINVDTLVHSKKEKKRYIEAKSESLVAINSWWTWLI